MDDSYASDGQGGGGGIFWKIIAVLILIGFMILGIKFMYDKRKEDEEQSEEDEDGEQSENEIVTKKR